MKTFEKISWFWMKISIHDDNNKLLQILEQNQFDNNKPISIRKKKFMYS